jgi:hypothetical protein
MIPNDPLDAPIRVEEIGFSNVSQVLGTAEWARTTDLLIHSQAL